MTFLTMESPVPHARRHAAHRSDAPVRGSGTGGTARMPPRPSPTVRRDARTTRRAAVEIGGAALVVLALHAALLGANRDRHETSALVVPPRPLPMTVELTRPPVPLPQAKQAPPPQQQPPQPVKQAVQPRSRTTQAARQPAPSPVQPTQAAPQAAAAAENVVAAAPAASPSTGAPAPVAETAPIGNAAYLHNPAPDYPPIAQDQGWEGHVLLRVHVLANGKPDSVDIRTSSGRKMLDEAALAAVRRWIFVPAKRGDEAVDGWVNVPIDFKLG
ncbi:energy transducer TonB [Paraburkholderia sp. JPY432]|uniref:energy transducer TonB n=1 Tax=Paraburkholderia youngii TaxID=2782701 RepID=UPI001595E775|nr:energy transducer TonB [Paraburkholderia youngii]